VAVVVAPEQQSARRGALKLCRPASPGRALFEVAVDVVSRAAWSCRAAARPLGLSKDHNCTLVALPPGRKEGHAVVLIHTEGSLVSFKRESRGWERPKKERGCIHGFSARARGRMVRLLAMLRRDSLPVFVTLTYPRVWNDDYRQWKRNLHAFAEWLRRWSNGRASAVWKLELQDRSAPHFHLLVYGVPFIPYQLLARVWYRIVGSGDVNHLMAGTSVEAIRSRRGVMSYASKRYMGKEWDSERSLGRCWGVLNRSALPLSPVRRIYLTPDAANRVFRVVRKRSKLEVRSCYHLFVQCPSAWDRFVTHEVMKE
jgi:hypothetical protein